MPRVKRGTKTRRRHKKLLKLAKGNVGGRRRGYRQARETVEKGLVYAYRDRKVRKREFRSLWIVRINAAARLHGLSYSRLIEGLKKAGYAVYGGVNAPYIWLKTPAGLKSWDFFDKLLSECHVVGTPGSGFGSCGEGYFRLSAFGLRENVEEAVARIARGRA